VLPRGIVCDGCNNYFSREVERPFLEAPAVKALRFHQLLESRKKRIPPINGIISSGISATVMRDYKTGNLSVDVPVEFFEKLTAMERGVLVLPLSATPPSDSVISRFLAKIALESMALRLCKFPEGIDYLADDSQFDPIREHARRGKHQTWPVHTRRIYAADAAITGEQSDRKQMVHEFDFLMTDQNELYHVIAIFGLEMTINIGGPDMDGYIEWLNKNCGASPLYSGKNSNYLRPS
jgi:hypothetical protein